VTTTTTRLVLDLGELEQGRIAEAGGKGAQLGELTRIAGVEVPAGFVVTTHAYRAVVAPALESHLARLTGLDPDDRDAVASVSADLRAVVAALPVPDEVAEAVRAGLDRVGATAAYAVRSSATAEDLPTASFAGQQDTYLNVVGHAGVLDHLRRCWASLFTDRAVTYRLRQAVDHRSVAMAVVIQRMVTPEASGVLFTADPVTSHRGVTAVEAVLGLGEALVSGVAAADRWTVRDGAVVDAAIADKPTAAYPDPDGGTRTHPVAPDARHRPALTDPQVIELAALGRRIEAHFGRPQDIEWCRAEGGFRIVQSRPITTLFPLPTAPDQERRVYLSVGHQQMMTDAMTPLGLSVWQMTTPRPMTEAGGRLFVDVTAILASPGRAGFLDMVGRGDPLVRDALETVLERDGTAVAAPNEASPAPDAVEAGMIDADPALVQDLMARSRESVAGAARDIRAHHGPELFDFIVEDFEELRRLLFDRRSHQVFSTAMDAAFWLDEHLDTWLGEPNVSATLTLSAPHNITSEMGLELLDVADTIRPHPEAVAFLRALGDGPLDGLVEVEGGREAYEALRGYLDRYGMRCPGEIDIGRPRWTERPAALVSVLVGHIDNAESGAGRRRFEQGRREAESAARTLLERLRALPDGAAKADRAGAMIDRLRTFIGYREYPKYAMISRYLIYRQALVRESERLVRERVLRDPDDFRYLRFDELREVARSGRADDELVRRRRADFAGYQVLTPPRVLTSDGEALSGAFRREDLPAGALAGLAVSRGTVEGRARVVLDMADADLEPGDILVTTFTDPSWSPAFVTVAGLVTEVGSTMSHGAVVAREYGLPAVVGVPGATRLITDGQRVRLNGTDGYVEIL
jgi:pyruvate,water dikinase